jgi:hypothetical protein
MKLLSILFCAITLSTLSACAHSTPKVPDVVFDHWQVMTGTPQGENVCYVGTAPTQEKGTAVKRSSQPYVIVTRRASGHLEISVSSGYPYMKGSRVVLVTDDDEHTLFFNGITAWAHNNAEDKKLLADILDADSIEVLGVAQDGKTSTDEYSNAGLSAALDYVSKHCK